VDIDAVQSEIKGNIGRAMFFYDTVESTNTVALELAKGTE